MGATVTGLLVVSCKARMSSGCAASLPAISPPIPSRTPPAWTLFVSSGGAISPGKGAVAVTSAAIL